MKTSAIEVHDMLSVLSVDEVEKRIGEVPGVQSVTVNFAAGNATVRYDETQLEATDIKSAVRQRGHDAATPAGAAPDEGRAGHSQPTALPPEPPKPAAPTSAPGAAVAEGGADAPTAEPAADAQPGKAEAEKS
jgi:Cu2+-exporting ATPase